MIGDAYGGDVSVDGYPFVFLGIAQVGRDAHLYQFMQFYRIPTEPLSVGD
jgi:hypothetical protein